MTNSRIGVMTGPGEIEMREVDLPEPGPDQVLVRLHSTAICTWEQRSYSGQQSNRFPFVGGHEIAGEVVAAGPGLDGDYAPGTRVALGPTACGRCHWCRTGREHACPRHYSALTVSYGDAWGPAGFADYKMVPADSAYPIGDAGYDVACLAEPLSCALHAGRMLDVQLGQDVVVVGAGVMGLMNVIAAKARGARVIVSEVDPGRLAKAAELGADETVNAISQDPVAAVRELTEGRGADVVIVAIGADTANRQGLDMLGPRGRFGLFASAYPETPLSIPPNAMHKRETAVIGTESKERADFYLAARLIRYGQVDLSPLIEASYPLADLPAALDHALKAGTYRILVNP
jgi:L-iditol 2-dehydrogenase